jgi:hypothetical protein
MSSFAFSSAADSLSSLREEYPVEKKRLFHVLDGGAQNAFLHQGLIERHFSLQDRPFTLRFAGAALEKAMCRTLAHLACDSAPIEPELTIDCWDCASDESAFPAVRWPAKYFSSRGDVMGLDSPQMRVASFQWLNLINVYFPEKKRAFYCLKDGSPFPLQQAGSPALTIFNWWAETLGLQLVHAAVVGTPAGGVLIAGHGGAGKSTLAFSVLGTPLRYLCDDYCLLAGGPARAVALFASGKLNDHSLKILPHLRARTANSDDPAREKALFYIEEQFPGELLGEVPLRAIVLSSLSPKETRCESIDPQEVYTAIADSTLRQLAGSHHRSFIRLRRHLDELPVFRLIHGSNFDATHRLLAQLCAS